MTARYPLRADGRWAGRVTRRPLPDEDLAALPHATRETLAGVWWSQAATEARVASSFAIVRDALDARGADPGLIDVSARAVDDEMRHATLCLDVAERYAGRALAPPDDLPFAHPAHPDASEDLRRALHVIGQCALNETFAAAYLEASLAGAERPLARAALSELLSDEVDHARIGWAFASTLDDATRAELGGWILPLAIGNLRMWRQLALPDDPKGELVAHGVPSKETVAGALREAVEALVIPGFARFGFDVEGLRAWSARGLPT